MKQLPAPLTDMPKRRYDVNVHACGDDINTLRNAMQAVVHQFLTWLNEFPDTSTEPYFKDGNSRGGYNWELKVDLNQNNEKYYKELNNYLSQKTKA